MLTKHRRAWSANTCLSRLAVPETVQFALGNSAPGTMAGIAIQSSGPTITMQCLPLASLILALGNPTVDYLSLDIEGSELEVLTSLPWHRLDIRAISMETQFLAPAARASLLRLLTSQGFTHLGSLSRDDLFAQASCTSIGDKQMTKQS